MEAKYLVPAIGAGALGLGAYALDKTGAVNLFGQAELEAGQEQALGACSPITVLGGADYAVTDIAISNTEPETGEQFQVTVTYTNNGDTAERTGEGVVLTSDKLGQLAKAPINYIEPGATDTVTLNVTINQKGDFTLCADIQKITL